MKKQLPGTVMRHLGPSPWLSSSLFLQVLGSSGGLGAPASPLHRQQTAGACWVAVSLASPAASQVRSGRPSPGDPMPSAGPAPGSPGACSRPEPGVGFGPVRRARVHGVRSQSCGGSSHPMVSSPGLSHSPPPYLTPIIWKVPKTFHVVTLILVPSGPPGRQGPRLLGAGAHFHRWLSPSRASSAGH